MMDQIATSRLDRSLFPYQLETRRPIVSLVFVAPLLLIYELGILLQGNQAVRNGLDEMFRFQMYRLGLGELILLPAITVGILLFWHHLKKDRWKFRPMVLGGMLFESIFLGFILLWAAKAQTALINEGPATTASIFMNLDTINSPQWWSNTICYLGAGIYEELVFRLLVFLPFLAIDNRLLGNKKTILLSIVVILSSLLFALLHYQGLNPSGAPFEWGSFAIRILASLFFCFVFLTRGFGIAVGTHAAYDVLTQF